jgi:type I restriction enzyme, S subunit
MKKFPRISLNELIILERRPVKVFPDKEYQEIGLYSFGKGIFHKPPRKGVEVGNKKLFQIKKGDFILHITFSWEGAIGLATIDDDGLFGSPRFPTFKIDEKKCNPKFLYHYFRTKEGVKQLGKISPGSALRNRVLSVKRISEIEVPLPKTLEEQKSIIDKIEKISFHSNNIKKSLEITNQKIEQYKQSFLKTAFEGKHTEKWPIKKIGDPDICELIGGGTPSRTIPEYFTGNIVWLTPSQIPKGKIIKISDSKEKITELALKKSSARIVPKNSVLLTSRASIGNVAIAESDLTTNQGMTSFICGKNLHHYFLANWLFAKKNLLMSRATGTTFKEISKTKLRLLDIPIPTMDEQKKITRKIKDHFVLIENTTNNTNSILSKVEILKSSILKNAFKGK